MMMSSLSGLRRIKVGEKVLLLLLFDLLFWWKWGLNSKLRSYKGSTLPFDPRLQSICSGYFWKWGLVNYVPGLASNSDPPNLSLREPPVPSRESALKLAFL
jgi:hypothetical protein